MRNYIHTLLNLPAILAGKATKADLSQAKIDIGDTVDAIADDNNRLAARIATLENLPAVKTGEPSLTADQVSRMITEAQVAAIKTARNRLK